MILYLKTNLVLAQFLFNHIKKIMLRYTNYYIQNPMCSYVNLNNYNACKYIMTWILHKLQPYWY